MLNEEPTNNHGTLMPDRLLNRRNYILSTTPNWKMVWCINCLHWNHLIYGQTRLKRKETFFRRSSGDDVDWRCIEHQSFWQKRTLINCDYCLKRQGCRLCTAGLLPSPLFGFSVKDGKIGGLMAPSSTALPSLTGKVGFPLILSVLKWQRCITCTAPGTDPTELGP